MSQEILKRKPGRLKGIAKVPGSGRKRGTLNHVTLLKEEINNTRTDDENYRQLKQKLWTLAFNGSVKAAKAWMEEYYRTVAKKFELKVSSFEDLDKAAEFLVQRVLDGTLAIPTGKALMAMLICKKDLREAALLPLIEEIIQQERESAKGRSRSPLRDRPGATLSGKGILFTPIETLANS